MKKNTIWMITLSLILALLFLTGCDKKSEAFAQIKEKLSLSQEKAAQVEPIFSAQVEEINNMLKLQQNKKPEMSSGERGPRGQKQTGETSATTANPFALKLETVNKMAELKLVGILTAEEITQYNEIIQKYIKSVMEENKSSDKNGNTSGGPGGDRGGPPPNGEMGNPPGEMESSF
jgi:lipoprotein NlpI